MKSPPVALEPFVEPIDRTRDFNGAAGYRIGYRMGPDGTAITSTIVTAEIIEKIVNLRGSVALTITVDGQVAVAVSYSNSVESAVHGAAPIDILVRNALNFENLRMEEASAADLRALLQRLQRSVDLVREAIDRMANYSKGP